APRCRELCERPAFAGMTAKGTTHLNSYVFSANIETLYFCMKPPFCLGPKVLKFKVLKSYRQ
ncbi:MAG: hypothetical protein AAB091_00170, partial [Elusimicrobiota bacterium]